MQQYVQVLEHHETAQRRQMYGDLAGQGLAIAGSLASMWLSRGRPGPTFVPIFLPQPPQVSSSSNGRSPFPDLCWSGNW